MEILDSGNRREFATGAVRDIQEGKGRCDLLPLDIVAKCIPTHEIRNTTGDRILMAISEFTKTNDRGFLYYCLDAFAKYQNVDLPTMFLEVSKHFEEGAKKYGEYNWQKGIPTHCYIDSAVRHYLKYLRGDSDEPHDRAFVWNIMCCIWTSAHKPELNDYLKKDSKDETEMTKKTVKPKSSRLKLWLTPNKKCHHCCLWCEHFNECQEDIG